MSIAQVMATIESVQKMLSKKTKTSEDGVVVSRRIFFPSRTLDRSLIKTLLTNVLLWLTISARYTF